MLEFVVNWVEKKPYNDKKRKSDKKYKNYAQK